MTPEYGAGWTCREVTSLQPPTAFYLRGEEYTAQLDAFIDAVQRGTAEHENSFASASDTDRVVDLVARAAKEA